MLSDNIVMRDHQLTELLSLNFANSYFLAVAALMVLCYKLKDWI